MGDLAFLASLGTMPGLMRQLRSLGGCITPIRLDGERTDIHPATGEILGELRSSDLPAGNLLVRCNNRRATRCAACAETYRRDTYQLITAGLRGGKGTPEQVATHPRVFATFTAPSFGPVHNRPGRRHGSMTDRLLTVEQAAQLLGTTARFPRRLIAERRIAFVKVERHVRIPEGALADFVAANTVQPIITRRRHLGVVA
ncbi:replication initiator [Streptomyces sp. 900116325]